MYAVIRAGGRQFRVSPGDVLRVDRFDHDGASLETADVLAIGGDGELQVNPEGATVTASVLRDGRAEKILVFHYKRKKQYKKLQGHRQPFTELRIESIQVAGKEFKS
jgi:large subunit ribosomal protein L21